MGGNVRPSNKQLPNALGMVIPNRQSQRRAAVIRESLQRRPTTHKVSDDRSPAAHRRNSERSPAREVSPLDVRATGEEGAGTVRVVFANGNVKRGAFLRLGRARSSQSLDDTTTAKTGQAKPMPPGGRMAGLHKRNALKI